ncbi:LysR family transcriptional regulator [Streptomyces sp. NPDC008079]|uniref:helix-turn-helix domain-containing protein n=1 Tax=Streptomyces sp. NPDC008079 TaxID=3364806 RepID=UPI0036E2D752
MTKASRGYRRGGPTPYVRVPFHIKATEGMAVLQCVAAGQSFRQAAAHLGMSATTAWRRYWWLNDYDLPARWGAKDGPLPPQRGTKACPRGRPYLPTLDGPGGPLGGPR